MNNDKQFMLEVYDALHKLGIPAHVRGYEFIKSGLTYLRQNQNALYSMTKEFYPGVAEIHQTTASKVERGIRHAIRLSRADDYAWERVTGTAGRIPIGETGRMANGEFIATLLESIKIKMAVEGDKL